jgi:hypothetical protein
MAVDTTDDAVIVARAYATRIAELFKVFAEGVATGEPAREGVVRFKRNVLAAQNVRDLALQALKEIQGPSPAAAA